MNQSKEKEQEKKYTKTGTTSRDRYSKKTDGGRTIISPTGIENPIFAFAGSDNWRFWSFIETLTPNELENLITVRKESIKYTKNSDAIKSLRNEITLLEDAHRIIKRRFNLRVSSQELIDLRPSSIKSYGSNILNILGFSYNTYYKTEVNTVVNSIKENYDFIDIISNWKGKIIITDELVATSIVKEILDKYNVEYNGEGLLNIYDINEIEFYKWHLDFHNWCQKRYWKA